MRHPAPRMQDATEIRVRTESARDNARTVEAKERILLNYHRAIYTLKEHELNPTISSTDYESQLDQYFHEMLEWMKHLSKLDMKETLYGASTTTITISSSDSPKEQNSFTLILSVARAVTLKRLLIIDSERVPCTDPFTALVKSVPDGSLIQLELCLESMDTCTMAAVSARNGYVQASQNFHALLEALDHRVLVMGHDFITRLQAFMSKSASKTFKNGLSDATLATRTNNIEPLLLRARDYCARSLSHYQSRGDSHENTIEWCNILLRVQETWRMHRSTEVIPVISEDDCDKIVAGVMSIKAVSQSSSGDHGSGLKTAREAWSKDGTQICTLVALFVCAFKYESSTVINFDSGSESGPLPFQNTILELDNAFATYQSLTKLGKGDDKWDTEKVFDAFLTMTHMSSDHVLLLKAVQHRWLHFAIEHAHLRMSKFCAQFQSKMDSKTSIFCILQHHISTLEKTLSKSFDSIDRTLIVGHFDDFKTILDRILKLVLDIRDAANIKTKSDYDMALVDDLSFGIEEIKVEPPDSISIFASENIRYVIGSGEECLRVGK